MPNMDNTVSMLRLLDYFAVSAQESCRYANASVSNIQHTQYLLPHRSTTLLVAKQAYPLLQLNLCLAFSKGH